MRVKRMKAIGILEAVLALAWLEWPARAQVVTEFRIPTSGSQPLEIAAGPGGMWFTESAANQVALITPDGQLSEFPVPRTPSGIVAGPDGNLWFTANDNWHSGSSAPAYPQGFVSRMTPKGAVTEFVSDPFSLSGYPASITVGPDGLLWFTDWDIEGGRIGHVSTAGQITETYVFTPAASYDVPATITSGPDGNLWFTVAGIYRDAAIDRVTPSGVATEFALPGVRGVWGIVTGSDGNLWFTETNANKVGRVTPSGVVTEFTVPGNPRGIAAGPDGNLWFTEYGGNRIGRISIHGQLTEFPIPTPDAQPWGISAGPDGSMWFTERGAGQIGRITLGSDAEVLRLDRNRFVVTVGWVSPTGSGVGHPVPMTAEAGYFWFSDPGNVEVVVKVLDWCPGGGIKFFAAGLTNFRVEMDVTDTQTGLTKHYENPQGVAFLPIQDSFLTCAPNSQGSIAGAWTGTWNANISGCAPLPAQAAFEQGGSIVRGTLTTPSTSCGLGGTFSGTLQGNTFAGSLTDDDFGFVLDAAGILSGGSLEITINGSVSVIGQLHLHR